MQFDRGFSRWPLLIIILLAALALAACTQPAATAPETPTTESPQVAAMAPAMDQDVPVSAFVSQHDSLSEEWDLLHDDFDQWSAGLSSCHPNAMHLALNDFAISFNDVTQQARSLTRGSTSGELADLLITAAEEEEASFRQLRDRWQPSNVSLFENVEQQRTKSAQAQKSAEDRAIELREGYEDTADPEATEEFLTAYDPVSEQWKQLHDDYEALRDDADTMGAAAVTEGLELHLEGLESIIDTLEELPELDGAEDAVDELLTAAKAEMDAFTAAIESGTQSESATTTTETSAESTTEASTETAESETTESAEATSTETAAADSGNGGSGLPDFDALNESVDASAAALKGAGRTFDDLADPDAERGLAELQVFDTEYQRLARAWAAFDESYNDWRKDDGGCDRTEVVAELEQYGIRISQLARDVRTLPNSGYLLPIYTLLTEAAARDENAIRTLRYTWQPFTLDSFKAVHESRINTDGLRREAEIAIQQIQRRS